MKIGGKLVEKDQALFIGMLTTRGDRETKLDLTEVASDQSQVLSKTDPFKTRTPPYKVEEDPRGT